jgi:hypothetical protein
MGQESEDVKKEVREGRRGREGREGREWRISLVIEIPCFNSCLET